MRVHAQPLPRPELTPKQSETPSAKNDFARIYASQPSVSQLSTAQIADPTLENALSQTSSASSISAASSRVPGTVAGDQVTLSTSVRTLSRLQDLQKSDPAELGRMLSRAADQIDAQAQSGGGARNEQLQKIAVQFRAASASGDLTKLLPSANPSAGSRFQSDLSRIDPLSFLTV